MKMPMQSLLFALMTGVVIHADVTFVFDYTGSTEFNHPTYGAARRGALEDAAGKLGRIFADTATVNIRVSSSHDSSSGVLASAISAYGDIGLGFYGYDQGVVPNKIQNGVDENGSAVDGFVDVNFGWSWDLDDDVSAGAFDFKATIIHELMHTLGFLSGINQDGTDTWGDPLGGQGVWEPFDDFITDKNGNEVISDAAFFLNLALWGGLSVGGASPLSGLYFNGPNARAANGGEPVGLYTPYFWEEGSSVSHLDDDNPALAGLLMLSSTTTGRYRRSLSDIERGILMDIGYSLHPLTNVTVEVATLHPGITASLNLTGPEDRWYAVERSVDLTDENGWVTLDVIEMSGGAVSINAALASGGNEQFIRLREVGVPAAAASVLSSPVRARR